MIHNGMLLSANKWESQEGSYAYIKAYMVHHNLTSVRVYSYTYDSCFHMNRKNLEFTYKDYDSITDKNKPCMSHTGIEIIMLANKLGFVPNDDSDSEEIDWESRN